MQKKIPTLTGIIIILASAAILLGGSFTYQYYMIKGWEAKNVTGLVNNQILQSRTIKK